MHYFQVIKGIGIFLFLAWVVSFPFFLKNVVTNTPLHLLVGGREYLTFIDYLPLIGTTLYGIGYIAERRRGCRSDHEEPLA